MKMENINCIAVIRKQNTEKFTQSNQPWRSGRGTQAAARFAHHPIARGDVEAQANAGPLAGNGQPLAAGEISTSDPTHDFAAKE